MMEDIIRNRCEFNCITEFIHNPSLTNTMYKFQFENKINDDKVVDTVFDGMINASLEHTMLDTLLKHVTSKSEAKTPWDAENPTCMDDITPYIDIGSFVYYPLKLYAKIKQPYVPSILRAEYIENTEGIYFIGATLLNGINSAIAITEKPLICEYSDATFETINPPTIECTFHYKISINPDAKIHLITGISG